MIFIAYHCLLPRTVGSETEDQRPAVGKDSIRWHHGLCTKQGEGHVGALPRRAYSGLRGNWDLSNSQRHLHGPQQRDSALQSALLRWGGVGDPQSQQRFLTLHCSEGTRTWEAILLPLGSPHSLARQMPLGKLSFQAPFEGHVP